MKKAGTGKLQVTLLRLDFVKEIVLARFQRLFRKSYRDVLLENNAKIPEEVTSCNFITD